MASGNSVNAMPGVRGSGAPTLPEDRMGKASNREHHLCLTKLSRSAACTTSATSASLSTSPGSLDALLLRHIEDLAARPAP
eukprot:CAMPEP_0180427226 /NCGR_PEP_ID=MMETSP1036_2-20121128/6205_1 /TAXON_ID=632150 /ORGANISM="Azadinium spinosum, Strain 3D9" /LENGTH=80 /DNA_ID=CAMNT_0022432811 /DNA_START=185 /DNA_END=427 /DNA_ORIENTATION=+